MEACRIGLVEIAPRMYDVGAPMKHKELCYEMLRDAAAVIRMTDDSFIRSDAKALTLVMDMSGTVDVSAPLPPREKCEDMLNSARATIERYDDAQAPVLRSFSDKVM